MKRAVRTMLLLLAGLLLNGAGGCGYNVGRMAHPELKTVAVAPATNETMMYNLASELRNALCEAFVQDGSLKLVSMSEADCIVYAAATSASFSDITKDSYSNGVIYSAVEWRVNVTVQYSIIIPGQGQPLFEGSATGTADFTATGDIESARNRATRQACYEASRKVIYALTEGW